MEGDNYFVFFNRSKILESTGNSETSHRGRRGSLLILSPDSNILLFYKIIRLPSLIDLLAASSICITIMLYLNEERSLRDLIGFLRAAVK